MGDSRTRNPKGQGSKLRTELLDAAAELIAESGSLESVGLRSIAKRAGVSPTAVYRHFESHEELLAQAVNWCWNEFIRYLRAIEQSNSPAEQFHNLGAAYVLFATNEYGKYQVLFNAELSREMIDNVLGPQAFEILLTSVTDLLNHIEDDRDPYFVSAQVHSWLHGIVGLSVRNRGPSWPTVSEQLADLGQRMGLTD